MKKQMKTLALALVVCIFTAAPSLATNRNDQVKFLLADDFRVAEDLSLIYNPDKNFNFYLDISAVNADQTVNAVIEIPAGTNPKFETDTVNGNLFWEIKKGAPRIVDYLGYPGNYGMIPRTLGGDGDPLDVVTLGKFQLRGTVSAVKVIGVIYLNDGGDIDDKLIALEPGSAMYDKVNSLADLKANYVGITEILSLWFESYKGPGEIQCLGFGDVADAQRILQDSRDNFTAAGL